MNFSPWPITTIKPLREKFDPSKAFEIWMKDDCLHIILGQIPRTTFSANCTPHHKAFLLFTCTDTIFPVGV